MVYRIAAIPATWGSLMQNENVVTWQIVRATSEAEARTIAGREGGDESFEIWQGDAVTVEVIDPNGPPGMLGNNA